MASRYSGDIDDITEKFDNSWIKSIISGNPAEAVFKPASIRLAHLCLREPCSDEDISEILTYFRRYFFKGKSDHQTYIYVHSVD